jgi:hypothetical protein
VPIILDGEPRALTNRANTQTKCVAAPSLKARGRVKASRNQFTTQVEHRRISVRAETFGFAAVRANERGANRRLRKCLLAINFRNDVVPNPVNL